MKVVDLTHTITPSMPVYPGTEQPRLSPANTFENSGFRETIIRMYSHTGTHTDAPAHLIADGVTLEKLPAAQFVGRALTIDCSDLGVGGRIGMDRVTAVKELADQAEFLLFHTGWDRYWGTEEYFGDYPVVTPEVVDYLIQSGKKGVGLDVIGLDPIADKKLPLHKQLLRKNDVIIVENLTRLHQTLGAPFILCALPMKYENADGAPTRAVALMEGEQAALRPKV